MYFDKKYQLYIYIYLENRHEFKSKIPISGHLKVLIERKVHWNVYLQVTISIQIHTQVHKILNHI